MKLTGKCKEDFDNYLFKKSIWKNWFYTLIPSMQYGVYVDFFDSVDVYISLDWYKSGNTGTEYFETDINNYIDSERFKTRPEARVNSIEKANEIYNLKL